MTRKSVAKGPARSARPKQASAGLPRALSDLVAADRESELSALWHAHDQTEREFGPEGYRQLGAYFRANDPLLAYEAFSEGLGKFPLSQPLRFQQSLTLARLGSTERAIALSKKLASEKIDDPDLFTDVLSLVARLNKDLGLSATVDKDRGQYLDASLAGYRRAYEHSAVGFKSYPAINAATLALVTGRTRLAKRLAGEARKAATAELKRLGKPDHWRVATLAEAALVLNEQDEAKQRYAEAVKLAGRRFDDIASMRRNARLIVSTADGQAAWIEEALRIPSVVVFTGHMIDRPERTRPRFPPALEPEIGVEIKSRLERLNAGFGYAGAACGSDILFHEAMKKRGQTYVVLPFSSEEFRKTSVDFIPGEDWPMRFDRVLSEATNVHAASGAPSEWGGIVFEYANLLLLGFARLKSRALDTDIVGLAVWDGGAGDGAGGTASTVEAWKQAGLRVEIISPGDYVKSSEPW